KMESILFSSAPLQSLNFERVSTVNLAGLQITLGWNRTVEFRSVRSTLVGWVVLICSLISLLLTLIVSTLQSIGFRAQAIANEKTFKLSESEQRFRAIVESSMIGTVISNQEADIIDSNMPFTRMLKYEKTSPSDTLKWSELTDNQTFLDSFKKTGLSGERHFYGELSLTRRDGTTLPVLVGSAPLLGPGFSTITYVIDLTEMKKTQRDLMNSELKFRSVTKSAVDGIVIFNEQGSITSWNDGARKIFDFTKEEVFNTSIFNLIEFAGKDHAVNISPLLGKSIEVQAKTKSNKRIPIELTMSSWQIEGEKYYSAILRDISERKKSEQDLIRAKEEALEGVKIKAAFLANMSHEIRTPLNGILGVADLMFETNLTSEQRRYAEIILNSGNNLLRIINDILDFSKIEAGKLQLENISFNLVNLVELQTDLMMAKARSRKLALACYIDPLLPTEFIGDPSRLGQIIGNLISNAIKFTQLGGVKIVVNAPADRRASEELLWLHFEVTDTGVGIAPEGLSKLFQSFTQIDESTSRQFGGTGLGLSISKNLVEMMGGRIGVESQKGVGSKFYFDIPFKVSPSAQRRSPFVFNKHWKPILLIDHEAFSREVTTAYLSSWGFPYESRASFEECIIAAKDSTKGVPPWSMILAACDSQYDRLKTFKVELQTVLGIEIPMIVLTDFESPLSLEQARSHGFAAALRKPLKQGELLKIVSSEAPVLTALEPRTSISLTQFENALSQKISKKRILVVDDSSTNRLVIVQLLEKIGYLSFAVSSGEEALQAVEIMPFDLILMDVQMPVMDGYEVTRRIRAMDSPALHGIPIIALTAYAMPGDEAKCLAAGMNDYLSKPVRKSVLADKLKLWLALDSDTGAQNAPL
ncbi:MAG: response regulator, partial [Bdellovibrio sp.]|nr:response regulator [Bdellovibrio sp.]